MTVVIEIVEMEVVGMGPLVRPWEYPVEDKNLQ